MIEYLKYLENNLGVDFQEKAADDTLLSMLLYEKNDDDVSVYDLIDAYLSLCKDVNDKYREFFNKTADDATDSKVSVLIRSMKIEEVSKEDDKYSFKLSASVPVPFSIKLMIEEIRYNNIHENVYVLGDTGDDTYELSFDPFAKEDYRAIVVAGLFREFVDLSSLYSLLKCLYEVCRKHTFSICAEKDLPLIINLFDFGKVDVYYMSGNNKARIMSIENELVKVRAVDGDSDLLVNFQYCCAACDPIWILKNCYVNEKYLICDLKQKVNYDSQTLDEIFKKSGYEKSFSYQDMYYDDRTLYYTYGDDNILEQIDDFNTVTKLEDGYKFIFNDDSSIIYPKDKIVEVVEEELHDGRFYNSDAVKSLNKKMG